MRSLYSKCAVPVVIVSVSSANLEKKHARVSFS
jgi:hypothetical protein